MENEYLCIIITQVTIMGYKDDILEISSRSYLTNPAQGAAYLDKASFDQLFGCEL